MRQLADRVSSGDTAPAFASFELIMSIFSAYEGNMDPKELSNSYPLKAWREDQVKIPRALLRPLVDGWLNYRDGDAGLTVGKALGLEGGGQGRRPAVQLEKKRNKDQGLSNKVVVDLVASALEENFVSQDAAIQGVADSEGVSYEAVRKAFQSHGKKTMKKLEVLGVRTSRSSYLSI